MTEPDGVALDLGVCHGLVIRPGDTLIVSVQQRLTPEHADELKRKLAKRLPGVESVVMDSGTQVAVYRPEG